MAAFTGTQAPSCSFWRLAAAGTTFYTVPSDHYNCPIGSNTHNIPLPKDREAVLSNTLSLMVNVGYIRMEEVPRIPRLPTTPAVTLTRRSGRHRSIPTRSSSPASRSD